MTYEFSMSDTRVSASIPRTGTKDTLREVIAAVFYYAIA